MEWYLKVLRQFGDFKGRTRRKEFWNFVVINIVFAGASMILDNLFGWTIDSNEYGPLYVLYSLIVLVPGIAVTVRRLHDVGKSGWMFLLIFIPVIGAIWLIILLVTESDPEMNKYGPNPKSIPVS